MLHVECWQISSAWAGCEAQTTDHNILLGSGEDGESLGTVALEQQDELQSLQE